MTNEEFESPEEDADGSAGRQRTPEEILAELAAKKTKAEAALAQLVKAAAVIEAQALSTD